VFGFPKLAFSHVKLYAVFEIEHLPKAYDIYPYSKKHSRNPYLLGGGVNVYQNGEIYSQKTQIKDVSLP